MKKLPLSNSFSIVTSIFIVLAVVASFSPLPFLSYAIVIGLLARLRPFSAQFFASYFTRVVVSFLVFSAFVMGTGMYCWLLDVQVHPLLVILPLLGLYMWAAGRWQVPWVSTRWAGRDDLIALSLGLFSILVIAVSFYAPKPDIAGSVQIATNGFDSGAHLSMIQTTYESKGYVYGKYEEIKDKIAWKTLTAYPQGWHLVNATLWQGMHSGVFDGQSREAALHMYAVTLLVWLGLANFLVARVSLYVLHLAKLGDKLKNKGVLLGFVAANVLIQMVVLWGSFYRGFAAFLAAVCFIMLLCAAVLAVRERKTACELRLLYLLACMAAMAVGLSWLLPAFVVIAMLGMVFVPMLGKEWWARLMLQPKEAAWYAAGTALFLVPLVAMIGVSHFFSVQGKNQINDTGGIFHISFLMVVLLAALAAWQFVRDRTWSSLFVAIVAPQFLFACLVYFYQYSTIGGVEYFFVKSMALLLCILGVFIPAAFVGVLSKLSFTTWPSVSMAMFAVMAVAGLVVATGQQPTNAATLLQRHSQFSHETAAAYGEVIKSGELMQRNVIVFTKVDYGGDVVGNVLAGALHPGFSECVGNATWVITSHRGGAFPQYLHDCITNEQVTVITSAETQPLFAGLAHQNIRTIMVQQ